MRGRNYAGMFGLALVGLALPSVAATHTPPPELVISDGAAGHPQMTEHATGTHFPAHTAVRLTFDTATVAKATTNSSGSWTATFIVPTGALPGVHQVIATAKTSKASKAFTVRTNWLDAGFGPKHNGVNPYENVLSKSNAASLQQQWAATPDNDNQAVLGADALANGVIYTSDFDPNYNDGTNYAINAATGKVLWAHGLGNVQGTPAVVGSTLYTDSQDGDIVAQDTSTGDIEWTIPAPGSIVAANNGILYTEGPAAIDLATHQILWQNNTTEESGGAAYDPQAGIVVYAGGDGNIHALNAATGEPEWSFVTGTSDPSGATPAIAGGVVYVGGPDDDIYALNENTGAVIWHRTDLAVFPYGAPAVDDGMVFVETDSTVTALSTATGDTVWVAKGQSSFGAGAGNDTPLVVANGVVYTMPLGAINETTGQVLFQATAATDGSIIVANGDIYVNTGPTQLAEYSQ